MKRFALFAVGLLLFPILAFAQVPPTPDDALALALKALSDHNYWVFVPAVVWLLVWIARRDAITNLVPWFGTKMGGFVLALAFSLAGGFLETAATTGTWTVAVVISILIKTAYSLLVSMGLNSTSKRAGDLVTPKIGPA